MILSIIIPFYNAGNYLEECLDSIFSQIAPSKDFEVICVDDGSIDNSSEKISKYLEKENFHLYRKDNEGVSIARNYGIEHSKGDFLWFVDADDIVVTKALQWIIETLSSYYPDVVLCDDFLRFSDNKKIPNVGNFSYTTSIDNSYIFPYVTNQIITAKQVIESNSIQWDSSLCLGEDILWIRQVLSYCNNIMRFTTPIYAYRENPFSASHSKIELLNEQRILLCNKLADLRYSLSETSILHKQLLKFNINNVVNAEFCSLANLSKQNINRFVLYNSWIVKVWILFDSYSIFKPLLQRLLYLIYPVKPYSRMFIKGIF